MHIIEKNKGYVGLFFDINCNQDINLCLVVMYRQMANVKWQMANGKWQMANVKWQMVNGKWQMANGKCQMAANSLLAKSDSPKEYK